MQITVDQLLQEKAKCEAEIDLCIKTFTKRTNIPVIGIEAQSYVCTAIGGETSTGVNGVRLRLAI